MISLLILFAALGYPYAVFEDVVICLDLCYRARPETNALVTRPGVTFPRKSGHRVTRISPLPAVG
jgi:hypothetical protein